ncbi:MAG: methyltransferase [Verrucomicrobia subdivision 3 bacterium]|nr:methyltransferase [Verrucomicrobiota bacterium]MCC6823102.1 methyltransferase [Limisphaerales bacterium]
MNTLTLPEPAVAGRPANGINHAHIPPRIAKIPAPTPNHILQTGLGFWASKTLLSATELGVFTELAKGSLDADTLRLRLGIHERSALDFFDALVALRFLERQNGRYTNTPESDLFLDRNKPSYVGGILEMSNARLFGFWNSLTEALRTGQPQNEGKSGEDFFGKLYASPEKLAGFLQAMTGLSLGTAHAIAEKFPWAEYRSVADVGAAQGAVPVQLALAHPHLTAVGYDLPVVRPIFEEYARSHSVANRVRFQSGDFFKDPLPKVDVIIMGHILHDWNLEQKWRLIQKAYDALPKGGAFIVYEVLIDDDRRENALGLLMSLNMLIETPGGFDYTGADCRGWMRAAGFRATRVEPLVGPDSMVIGIK